MLDLVHVLQIYSVQPDYVPCKRCMHDGWIYY